MEQQADGTWTLGSRATLPVEEWNAQISLLTGMCAARLMIDGRIGVLRTLPGGGPARRRAAEAVRARARVSTGRTGASPGDVIRGPRRVEPGARGPADGGDEPAAWRRLRGVRRRGPELHDARRDRRTVRAHDRAAAPAGRPVRRRGLRGPERRARRFRRGRATPSRSCRGSWRPATSTRASTSAAASTWSRRRCSPAGSGEVFDGAIVDVRADRDAGRGPAARPRGPRSHRGRRPPARHGRARPGGQRGRRRPARCGSRWLSLARPTRSAVMSELDDVADELYGGPPSVFIEHRDAAAKAARADGDRELAKQITELRKPTVSAWLMNLLVRDDPGFADQVVALGEGLRDAERSLDGPALRELSTPASGPGPLADGPRPQARPAARASASATRSRRSSTRRSRPRSRTRRSHARSRPAGSRRPASGRASAARTRRHDDRRIEHALVGAGRRSRSRRPRPRRADEPPSQRPKLTLVKPAVDPEEARRARAEERRQRLRSTRRTRRSRPPSRRSPRPSASTTPPSTSATRAPRCWSAPNVPRRTPTTRRTTW